MFFYEDNIDDVERLIIDIKKYYEIARKEYSYLNLPPSYMMFSDVNNLYKIVSNYYPYSGIVIVNNKQYLCVNDLFYIFNDKIVNIKNNYILPSIVYKYIDDNLNKNNIKHL